MLRTGVATFRRRSTMACDNDRTARSGAHVQQRDERVVPCVGGLAYDTEGRLLLVQRARAIHCGAWTSLREG